jgi:hypothetical protein
VNKNCSGFWNLEEGYLAGEEDAVKTYIAQQSPTPMFVHCFQKN